MIKEQSMIQTEGTSTSKIPVWRKPLLSVTEAAKYFGIGEHKLYEMTADRNCDFVLWNGNKRMIKREQFEAYLKKSYSI